VLDNLTRVAVGVTSNLAARDHYYCYDTKWQLTNVKTGGCTGASVIGLSYDVQGNLANRNGTTHTFDYGNRLRIAHYAGATVESYRYDVHGRRVRSWSSGGSLRSVYSNAGELLYQRNDRTGKATDYIMLNGDLVATIERPLAGGTGTVTYQHTDALGSPVAVTNASRTVIESSEYVPFGRVGNRAARDGAGYTGHAEDAATGLTYMQQRYYDPQIGRFLSVDPVTAYSNPVGAFNRYWYASNNPYRFTDPDGREIVVKRPEDRGEVASWINQRAKGTYSFDKAGRLQMTSASGSLSKTYQNQLNAAIKSGKVISISIGSAYVRPGSLEVYSVKDSGGALTDTHASRDGSLVNVVIDRTAQPAEPILDQRGRAMTYSPADKLTHELPGHAIPAIVGGGTGNALDNENRIRQEISPRNLRQRGRDDE